MTVTAKDAAGNTATGVFDVIVRDTTAPVLKLPATQTVEATGPSGASVNYPPATATDAVGVVSITYSHESGTTFALGTTHVTVTAEDAAGNTATGGFDVIVRDTTAPVLKLPATQTVEATGPSGAIVNYPAATATDAVGVALGHVLACERDDLRAGDDACDGDGQGCRGEHGHRRLRRDRPRHNGAGADAAADADRDRHERVRRDRQLPACDGDRRGGRRLHHLLAGERDDVRRRHDDGDRNGQGCRGQHDHRRLRRDRAGGHHVQGRR